MLRPLHALDRSLRRAFGAADAAMNRLYSWRYNPLYLSGALTAALLAILIATGLYLLLYYRIGAPYASVARLAEQPWAGRWIRGVHRYASDAAIITAGVHALRMFAQGRRWGPRALAWISGLALLALVWVCGWTGYVMVWDVFGQLLAAEGARFLDVLPIFGEPIGRIFVGERPIPGAFFFLNLFAHIAIPIGLGGVLWLHVSRVQRPVLIPPRRLLWTMTALLVATAIVWPMGMAAEGSPFRIPASAPIDLLYAFWLPVTHGVNAVTVWLAGGLLTAIAVLVPWWSRPRAAARPVASLVDERRCTGCEQCALDCPFEAITMIARTDGRATLVAHVDPDRCVSCGICTGSCAPMGVGPAGRTGRDQLAEVRAFVEQRRPDGGTIVLVACTQAAGGTASSPELPGAMRFPVNCAGNLHSSTVEFLVRAGVQGVLVLACPPRDCWNREGVRWTEERIFHEREAELQERVDRRRVRIAYASAGERTEAIAAIAAFRADLAALDAAAAESNIDVERPCALDDPALQETR